MFMCFITTLKPNSNTLYYVKGEYSFSVSLAIGTPIFLLIFRIEFLIKRQPLVHIKFEGQYCC